MPSNGFRNGSYRTTRSDMGSHASNGGRFRRETQERWPFSLLVLVPLVSSLADGKLCRISAGVLLFS